ncbi:uncharacterized protein METZ01_LOCUS479339 [marine metagenome]|uniref:Uncharacterized protein n=1 Tax=marine metagenome TaxID=408172 RepID=A0A383C4G3_9ZZZZ
MDTLSACPLGMIRGCCFKVLGVKTSSSSVFPPSQTARLIVIHPIAPV